MKTSKKLTPDEFRKSMGFDIKNKPANMNDIAEAIRKAAEDLRGKKK